MKRLQNTSPIGSIIRHSGFVVTEAPSPEHPAMITLVYRNNPDGSVRWLWPKGGKHLDFLRRNGQTSVSEKWMTLIEKTCFALGLGSLLGDGKLKLYADPSTASYIRNKWHGVE